MAPEQDRAPSKVDCRADIYSLGVVFYELLTGSRPPNEGPHDLSLKGHVDRWLHDIVLRALANDPDDRFQQVEDLINAIHLGPFLKDPIQRYQQPRLFDQPPLQQPSSGASSVLMKEPEIKPLAPGTVVECRWKGGPRYFLGKITEIEGDRIHIDYDDGDKEWTTVDMIRFVFAPGTVVRCRWKGGHKYYQGKITGIDGNRIHVDYDDGDKEWTTADMIQE